MPIYTQAITLAASSAGAANLPITTTFTPVTGSAGGGFTTITLPAFTTGAVGDLIVLTIRSAAVSMTVASVKATGWTQLSQNGVTSIWYGVVTAGGSETITLSNQSNSSAVSYAVTQFTSTPVATTWTPGGAVATNPAGTTVAWAVPAALPSAGATNGFLYLGANIAVSSTPACTSAGGYVAVASLYAMYNLNVTAVGVPPAMTLSPSGTANSVGAFVGAYGSSGGGSSNAGSVINISPVPMGKSWVMSQMGFECIPATSVTTATTTVTFNGRLLFGNTNANGGFVQGPPYVTINAGDTITVTPTGLPIGSSAVVNLYYNEYVAGQVPDASNTV